MSGETSATIAKVSRFMNVKSVTDCIQTSDIDLNQNWLIASSLSEMNSSTDDTTG